MYTYSLVQWFRVSGDPKVPHEYRNPFSNEWDCYKTELVSGLGD
jgi:hypothetical protein